MPRFFIRSVILPLLAAGSLAPAALAQSGGKPPRNPQAGGQPGPGGQRPGQYIGGSDDGQGMVRGTNNVPGGGQRGFIGAPGDGQGIFRDTSNKPSAERGARPGAPAQFGDQPGLNGQDMMVHRPGAGQTQIIGDVQEGTGIRRRQQPARTGQSPVAGHVQDGNSAHPPRERRRARRR